MFDTKQFNEVRASWIDSPSVEFVGSIDGTSYYVDRDIEDDNVKMVHMIKTDIDGRVYMVDHSPYSYLTIQEVAEIGFFAMELAEYDNQVNQESEFDHV